MNKSSLHNWVNGVSPSGLEGIERLAKVFGISAAELVSEPALEIQIKLQGDPKGQYRVRVEKKW